MDVRGNYAALNHERPLKKQRRGHRAVQRRGVYTKNFNPWKKALVERGVAEIFGSKVD